MSTLVFLYATRTIGADYGPSLLLGDKSHMKSLTCYLLSKLFNEISNNSSVLIHNTVHIFPNGY